MPQGPGRCYGCKAKILWAVTVNGKGMPLDYARNPSGNVAVHWNENDIPCATVITPERPALPGEAVYMPHFATCPSKPKPKTKLVTEANAKTVAKRQPRYEAAPLPLELPENVVPFKAKRGES
jgi:hypothetical protein